MRYGYITFLKLPYLSDTDKQIDGENSNLLIVPTHFSIYLNMV